MALRPWMEDAYTAAGQLFPPKPEPTTRENWRKGLLSFAAGMGRGNDFESRVSSGFANVAGAFLPEEDAYEQQKREAFLRMLPHFKPQQLKPGSIEDWNVTEPFGRFTEPGRYQFTDNEAIAFSQLHGGKFHPWDDMAAGGGSATEWQENDERFRYLTNKLVNEGGLTSNESLEHRSLGDWFQQNQIKVFDDPLNPGYSTGRRIPKNDIWGNVRRTHPGYDWDNYLHNQHVPIELHDDDDDGDPELTPNFYSPEGDGSWQHPVVPQIDDVPLTNDGQLFPVEPSQEVTVDPQGNLVLPRSKPHRPGGYPLLDTPDYGSLAPDIAYPLLDTPDYGSVPPDTGGYPLLDTPDYMRVSPELNSPLLDTPSILPAQPGETLEFGQPSTPAEQPNKWMDLLFSPGFFSQGTRSYPDEQPELLDEGPESFGTIDPELQSPLLDTPSIPVPEETTSSNEVGDDAPLVGRYPRGSVWWHYGYKRDGSKELKNDALIKRTEEFNPHLDPDRPHVFETKSYTHPDEGWRRKTHPDGTVEYFDAGTGERIPTPESEGGATADEQGSISDGWFITGAQAHEPVDAEKLIGTPLLDRPRSPGPYPGDMGDFQAAVPNQIYKTVKKYLDDRGVNIKPGIDTSQDDYLHVIGRRKDEDSAETAIRQAQAREAIRNTLMGVLMLEEHGVSSPILRSLFNQVGRSGYTREAMNLLNLGMLNGLRADTGAAVTDTEFQRYDQLYLPQMMTRRDFVISKAQSTVTKMTDMLNATSQQPNIPTINVAEFMDEQAPRTELPEGTRIRPGTETPFLDLFR